MSNKVIEKREKFLSVYFKFDSFLNELGFVKTNSNTTLDFHYSKYDEIFNSLYSVEYYKNDLLKISLRFLRDRNKHRFIFAGGFASHSQPIDLEEFKLIIKNHVDFVSRSEFNKIKVYRKSIKKLIT